MLSSKPGRLTRRALLGAVVAVGSIPLLAACGASGPGSPATGSASSSQAASAPGPAASSSAASSASAARSAAAAAPSSLKGTIQFLNVGGQQQTYDDFSKTILPAFQKANPGIQVQMQTTDWGPSFQKISTAVAAGTAPDVFVMGGLWTGPLASKGALLDIDSELATWAPRSDIPANVWSDAQWEGKTYSVPFNLDTRTVVYRKDLYDGASLQPPATWADLKDAGAKLAQHSGDTVTREGMDLNISTGGVGVQQSFINLLYEAGGDYFSPDGKKATFSSDAGKAALSFMVDLIKQHISSVAFTNPPTGPAFLTIGKTATSFGGINDIANAKLYAPDQVPHIALGMPLRMDAQHDPKTLLFINKLGIFKGTKAPDAAWALVADLMDGPNLTLWLQTIGNLPTRDSVAQSAPFVRDDPNAQILLKTVPMAKPQAANPAMFDIVQILTKQVTNALYLRASVDDTLKALDSQVDQALQG